MRTILLMRNIHRVLFLGLLSWVVLFFSVPVFAQDNQDEAFSTKLESTYKVSEAGTTTVEHSISITNNTPTTFIQQYALKTSFVNLANITVTSNGETITPNVVADERSTSIGVTFPDEIVGEGKTRTFSISYVQEDLATVAGNVLEIHIPEIADKNLADSHTVILETPTKYGTAVRSTPESSSVTTGNGVFITTYDVSKDTPISALFGSEQSFAITLRYNLENTTTSTGITQIALPPDTAFQKMYYHSIDPLPEEMDRDLDGNWIATYKLAPNTATTVYLTADVHITLDPQPGYPTPPVLPAHTQSQKYWNTKASEVQSAIAGVSTAEDIYTFVVDTLSYSYQAVEEKQERLGSETALKNPESAVCQEFTDVFVTLSRANGIPARRLTGYAYTANTALRPLSLESDILHAWPEYYDETAGIWRQIDPTWGNTTNGIDYFHQFDLNHIVFAINGVSSTTPYAAGSYKVGNFESKDVEVSFTETPPTVEPEFNLTAQADSLFATSIPGRGVLRLENTTGRAWYDVQVAASTSSDVTIEITADSPLRILPFQTLELPVAVISNSLWNSTNTPVSISITTQDTTETYELTLRSGPAFVKELTERRIVIGLVASITISTLIAGSVLVFRRR